MRDFFRFLQNNVFVLTFLLCEIISVTLVILNNDYQNAVASGLTSSAMGSVYEMRSNVSDFFKLNRINRTLTEENARLRRQLQSSHRSFYHDTTGFNDFITQLTARKDTTDDIIYEFYPAEIVYNSTQSIDNKIIINKGKYDGMKEGMGVISSTSVVGIITKTTKHYALVMPVLNSNFRLSVKPAGINEFGMLNWDGEKIDRCMVYDIPTHANVREKDTIVTSGLSKTFPPNIPVGTVNTISNDPGKGVLEIEISFVDDYRKALNVYVVNHLFAPEIDTLMN